MKTIKDLAKELSAMIDRNASASEVEAKRQEILNTMAKPKDAAVAIWEAIQAESRMEARKAIESMFSQFTMN